LEVENGIIVHQILFLAVLVLVGVLATKLRVISESVKDSLAKVIFNVTLPLLIFTSVARIDLSPDIIRNSGMVFLYTYLALFIMFLAGSIFARILGLKGQQRAVFINHHIYGNIVFLGFPLLDALFPGGEGLLYAAMYQLASNTSMWTFGVWIFVRENKGPQTKLLRNLLNPNTIALILGLVVMFTGLHIPDLAFEPFFGMGKTTIYLSMLYIGAMLSYMSWRGVLKRLYILLLSFNKLLLVPAILAFVVFFLSELITPNFGMIARKVVILQASMPCMAIIVVLAKQFKSDDALATENVFVSTIASLFTLPLVYTGLVWLEHWISKV